MVMRNLRAHLQKKCCVSIMPRHPFPYLKRYGYQLHDGQKNKQQKCYMFKGFECTSYEYQCGT